MTMNTLRICCPHLLQGHPSAGNAAMRSPPHAVRHLSDPAAALGRIAETASTAQLPSLPNLQRQASA
jgi:hypothetical protein